MYPPTTHQPKVLLVRPRSSLSTKQEQQRFRNNVNKKLCCNGKKFTVLEQTLCGFCIFLIVFCSILLTGIVLIGKTLLNSSSILYNNDNISYNCKNNFNQTVINTNDNRSDNVIKYQPKIIARLKKDYLDKFRTTIVNDDYTTTEFSSFTINDSENDITTNIIEEMSKSADQNINSDKFVINSNIFETKGSKMSKILNKLNFRLPREIKPRHYDLYLKPNLKEKIFNGKVAIQVEIQKPINYIAIHSKLLSVTESKLYQYENGKITSEINPSNLFSHDKYEYWVMEFDKDLPIGEYLIKYSFNGSLINRIVGFYGSTYKDPSKDESIRYIATSKFEPTYARQAFPCFDEPDMKAKFTVTLIHPKDDGYMALSNMDVKAVEEEGDFSKTVFAESVKMSTYLACFIVSDFTSKEVTINTNGIGENFKLRVFATTEQINKVQYSLEVGKKITEYYIKYFNIPYPLPKLDMAAIPDFVSGAMEHWGLVTFRETSLLYDPAISSSANKQRVGNVIAHELAHMWFGNLVTMKWWNDLWLNEGFASYIQYKGLNEAHPDWNMLDQFLIEGFHSVLTLDGTLASHPIVQKVENPDQITELFDKITYEKGAAIIRMLEDFVGHEKFQKAVTAYLNKFKYSNAVTQDLLEQIALMEFDFDVEHIMKTWTVQMGLPVVSVKKINEREYVLKQKRFFANPEDENKEHEQSEYDYRWEIPITYVTSEDPKVTSKWFKFNETELKIIIENPPKWIKFNKNQVGYYRVNYSNEMWQDLIKALKTNLKEFSVSDRAHLLNDAFALADAMQLPYGTALDLTTYIQNENDYVPWHVAAHQLEIMKNLLKFTSANAAFVKFGNNLVKDIYEKIGWKMDTNHLNNLLRVTILGFACKFGNENCLAEAEKLFNKWLVDNESIQPDLKTIVYNFGMKKAGTEQKWDEVWKKYLNEIDANEKAKLMGSLASIEDISVLTKFVNLAWDERNVRSQDYFQCLQKIAENPIGEGIVWNYVRDNWEKFVKRFGLNERYMGNMIPAITKGFASNIKLKEMKTFFDEYPEAGAGATARKQAIANVEINIKWLTENEQKIAEWLKDKKY